jgi:hypothetical protein
MLGTRNTAPGHFDAIDDPNITALAKTFHLSCGSIDLGEKEE